MAYRLEKCILAALAAAGTYSLWASRADAQEMDCRPSEQIYAELHKAEMSEVAVMGVNPQVIWLVYATPGGREWKLISTRVDGMSCIVVSGAGYENIPVIAEGRPS
jgi:hypothetical protein